MAGMNFQDVYVDAGDKEMLEEFMAGATDIDAIAAIPADQYEVLVKRLQKDEELIRKLKHIVKAQHGKIEEFREMLEASSVAKSPLISAYEAEDCKKAVEKNQELHLRISQLQAELAKVKAENSSLKKVNRRFKGLLYNDSSSPQSSLEFPALQVPALPSTAPGAPGGISFPRSPGGVQSGRNDMLGRMPLTPLTCRGRFNGSRGFEDRDHSSSRSPPRRQDDEARRRHPGSHPPFSRVSTIINSMSLLWREFESALSCLRAMADVSARLLADRKTSNITIFIVDPWLRKAVTLGHSKTEQLTIFYLGQGKTELQALVRLEESKVCPPLFTDLQALPFRSKTGAALPVLTPNRSRVWAVLQVMLEDTKMAESEANFVPRILQDAGVSQEINLQSQCFTDSHVNYLQLLCSFMGGVFLHIERLEHRARIVDRTRSIMEGAIDVNKAKTLADFEQRVKHLFSSFFSVSTIRVLFFDPDSKSLLISSSQMRKKGTTTINMTKGILGQCAQKQQVICVADIHQNPFVDVVADGLQRNGRPVGKHAAMLVGPMLVESLRDERSGQELLGVVQLLEKKRRGADGSTQPSEFLPDEQQLFNQLLTVCSHAGSRTMKVQQLSAQLAGTPYNVQALLFG